MLRCAVNENTTTRTPLLKSKGQPNLKHNLRKAYPADQKERGEWVELLFMANAARLGLKVAKPHGDSSRYDVIVQGGGRLYRVQVKSTVWKRGTCYPCTCSWASYEPGLPLRASKVALSHSWKMRRNAYTTEQADFIAAYVIPEDTWFIIPVTDIRSSELYLPKRDRAATSRYAPYLEAWHQLGVRAEGLTIHSSAEDDFVLALIKAKLAHLCGLDSVAR